MKKILIAFVILFSSSAFSGVLVEPYLGYNIGKADFPGFTNKSYKGLGYGARLGYSLPVFFFGVDINQNKVKYTDQSFSSETMKQENIGIIAGADLLLGLRVFGGYNFKAEMKSGGDKTTGDGFKIGAGFKMPLLPIAFNLEYFMNKYDEINGVKVVGGDIKFNSLFLSVSAPLEL